MPAAADLPDLLERLAYRRALELSPARFNADVRRLVTVLDSTLIEIASDPVMRNDPGDPTDSVERVLRRLVQHGSPHVREAAEGLRDLGYDLKTPVTRVPGKVPEAYLRFEDPDRPGPATGYLTPQNISFTRDRQQLQGEPGGHVVPSTGEIAFSHINGPGRGLEIAARLKCGSRIDGTSAMSRDDLDQPGKLVSDECPTRIVIRTRHPRPAPAHPGHGRWPSNHWTIRRHASQSKSSGP